MFEANQTLLPKPGPGKRADERLKALCVGFEPHDMGELHRLLDTLSVDAAESVYANLRQVHAGTYIGMGKLEEMVVRMEEMKEHEHVEIDTVIFDVDLSPNQLRNIEKILGKPVLDRAAVILEIFFQHARTREAKVQVELARVQYLLPRLAHYWTHFERQRGGIGNKGMGEKQIEVDRRLLKRRVGVLQSRLKEIQKERKVQRESRDDILKVAFVGYTNAGKSTLLNRMTHSKVLEEDKLFSTLDSCVRALDPDCHPPVVAIDTVGFISRIPTHLVASFRSTLEELEEADLLLHVVDGSSTEAKIQLETTLEILTELGLEDKPRMVVVNKIDQVTHPGSLNWLRVAAPGAIRISALDSQQVEDLRVKVLDYFRNQMSVIELLIPYAESKVEAQIHQYGSVEVKRHMEKGTFFKVRMEKEWASRLELSRFELKASTKS